MTAAEALGCQACGLPITPCLVCASPLPVSQADDALMKTCRSCGVVNPLGKVASLDIASTWKRNPMLCFRLQMTARNGMQVCLS
jgi:hypothetical protein